MPSPAEFAEALRGRRNRERRRTWSRVVVAATATVLVAALVWLFFFSDTFRTRAGTVEGNALVSADDVLATAAIPTGMPLVLVDTEPIEARVLELPEVRSVTVARDFPDAVRITVEERAAVYQLQDGGTHSWVDADGIVFRTNQASDPELPVVRVSGERDERILADIATVVRAIPPAVAGQVERVDAASVDRIQITLADDRTVVWGSADDSDLKSRVLTPLLGVDAKVYDVSAPNHPTTR
ncbi:cell division protein FtsQ/DivIB [Tessaracoccus oleiagri]|uniref:Cell division protein FtsQ n=1 Tax=Tessaracoccus oleiagri TaxID=686624 RepID=A0A1G9L2Y7_9ACTN|nr:FtsQ-type POTRA domain-containing protein [Tessaracoccus oleiagri]SDL56153.1 cell division protein FtsQ [Tessaracoccus oleiagri]